MTTWTNRDIATSVACPPQVSRSLIQINGTATAVSKLIAGDDDLPDRAFRGASGGRCAAGRRQGACCRPGGPCSAWCGERCSARCPQPDLVGNLGARGACNITEAHRSSRQSNEGAP
jgi:hypothetical protein